MDQDLVLLRRWLYPRSTVGELFLPALDNSLAHECFICEDVMRMRCAHCGVPVWKNTVICEKNGGGHHWVNEKKVSRETAIPLGRYRINITPSTRFGRMMPLLWNVETKDMRRLVVSADGLLSFEGIRVHWGNSHVDTDGCLLTGRQRGLDKAGNGTVSLSVAAYDVFVAKLEVMLKAKPELYITVKLAPDGERLIS